MLEWWEIDQCSYPELPKVSEGILLYLTGTTLLSPQEKKEREKNLKRNVGNQTEEENPAAKSRISLLEKMSASEVLLSLFMQINIEKQGWTWVHIKNELLPTIHTNRFNNSKLPTKERLQEELDYLINCGYIRSSERLGGENFQVILTQKIRDILTPNHIIYC